MVFKIVREGAVMGLNLMEYVYKMLSVILIFIRRCQYFTILIIMLFVPCQPPAGAKRPPGHPTTHQTKDQNSSLHYVPLATLHSQPPPRGFRSLNRNLTVRAPCRALNPTSSAYGSGSSPNSICYIQSSC